MPAYKSTYETTHQNFVKAYRMINDYVTELYLLPKKMAEDAGEALENYHPECHSTNGDVRMNQSCKAVIDFMDQLDEFTVQTLRLYNEHKKHITATREYMRKVTTLHLNQNGKDFGECPDSFHGLTPELNNLMVGLREIKRKADDMVERMEKLELKWEHIKIGI